MTEENDTLSQEGRLKYTTNLEYTRTIDDTLPDLLAKFQYFSLHCLSIQLTISSPIDCTLKPPVIIDHHNH